MLAFDGKPKFLEKYAVVGFEAVQALGEIGMLQISLRSRLATSEPHLKSFVGVQKSLGDELKCKVGDWHFNGTVESITYDSSSRHFRVLLHDALAKLDGVIGSNVFADQTIKDIVSGVAPAGVKVEYLSGFDGIKVKLAIQYQETALTFIKRLLSEYGGQLWCDGEKIYIGAEPTSKSKTLRLDKEVSDFIINTRLGAEQVELESIPYAKNNPSTSKIGLKGGKFGEIQDAVIDLRKKGKGDKKVFHIVHEDSGYDDSTHFANRFLRSQAAGRFVIDGRVTVPVDLGSKVTIQGLGAEEGKEITIIRSVQCVGDYMNNETVWQFEAVNPEAVLSGGGQSSDRLIASTAIVADTNDDMNRVKVKFLWDGKQRVTPWFRLASPSWGKEHMHFLPPKKDDTVLVVWGLVDMDPVVLGCVTGGDKVGEPNSNLVLQTVDGQTITISQDKITMKNDDVEVRMEKKLVEIDSAGSKIKMDPNDIELKANGSIKIDATGSITLDSTAGIELKTMKLDIG